MMDAGKQMYGPKFRYLYEQTVAAFRGRVASLLEEAKTRRVSFSAEFELCATAFLPQTREGWLSLLTENPWLLDGTYNEGDVADSCPTPRESLRAATLSALSDVFICEFDLLAILVAQIGKVIDDPPWERQQHG